jgi:hypothetical protein
MGPECTTDTLKDHHPSEARAMTTKLEQFHSWRSVLLAQAGIQLPQRSLAFAGFPPARE